MTILVTPVHLLNVEQDAPEAADLLHGIGESQIADWEGEWLPELFKALQRLRRSGVDRRYWPQSRHWNWRTKVETLQGMLAQPGFSIVCGGLTQGMMLLELVKHRCRIDTQSAKNLVYIDFLENAPWNRRELVETPRYRGVGTVLFRAAIETSINEGFKGRVGLHSLPQANSFYANVCGMTDLGADPNYQGLRYFEMSQQQAEAFIKKGNTP